MHVTCKNSHKLILLSKVPLHLITESKVIKNKNNMKNQSVLKPFKRLERGNKEQLKLVNGPLSWTWWIFCCNIVIRNKKIVRKHGSYRWYFRFNLKYLGCPYREYIKTAKNGFCEELLSENDFEAVLATFCCYDYGAKASEAVQKIATDQKEYRKCSSCVIICWIAKIYLSINNSEKRLVTRTPPM